MWRGTLASLVGIGQKMGDKSVGQSRVLSKVIYVVSITLCWKYGSNVDVCGLHHLSVRGGAFINARLRFDASEIVIWLSYSCSDGGPATRMGIFL